MSYKRIEVFERGETFWFKENDTWKQKIFLQRLKTSVKELRIIQYFDPEKDRVISRLFGTGISFRVRLP